MWKHGFHYSLLRRLVDPRPIWAANLGIHSILLNGEVIQNEYPRLRYKRKQGSFPVHPFAEESYRNSEVSRYEQYLMDALGDYK